MSGVSVLPCGRGLVVEWTVSAQFAYASVVGADGQETVALFNYDVDATIAVDLNGVTYEVRPNDVVFAKGKQDTNREAKIK